MSAQPARSRPPLTIFAQPTAGQVGDQVDTVAVQLAEKLPAAAEMLTGANPDLTTFAIFPQRHRFKVWSNNPIERLS